MPVANLKQNLHHYSQLHLHLSKRQRAKILPCRLLEAWKNVNTSFVTSVDEWADRRCMMKVEVAKYGPMHVSI